MEKSKDTWTVLSSEYLHRAQWLTVRKDHVVLPNGNHIPSYYILEYPNWVNTIAITRDGQFVFIRQYRHGIQETSYELCAGVCEEEDGSPMVSAQRELLEETGVDCACLEPIRTFSTPGRDPRRWVISCAYLALLDATKLQVKAADDAKDARWFQIFLTKEKDGQWNLDLKDTSSTEPATIHLTFPETYPESAAPLLLPALHLTPLNPENGLAFDHGAILGSAAKKLQHLLVEN